MTSPVSTPRGPASDFVVPPSSGGPFGVYIHVPFCSVRCGYCDFNTYTSAELGGGGSRMVFADTAVREMHLATKYLSGSRPASTIFLGGGTPTLLPASDLLTLVAGVRDTFGYLPNAEITTEANPDSVTPEYFEQLASGGFTRVSIGMQSSVPQVLATLERTHTPSRVADAVVGAKAAGLQVSLDLIYGTPGESMDDWRRSLEAVLNLEPDHVSAYALVIEPGTRMARQVRTGALALPDLDDQATKYELADELLSAGGLEWYEISNWSRGESTRCQHNLAYWRNAEWWGVGPGAHSHVAGTRFWNLKHPSTYALAIDSGVLPVAGFEKLNNDAVAMERVLLEIRLREGFDSTALTIDRSNELAQFVADGSIDGRALLDGRIELTLKGRLLADAIVRALV